MYDAFIITVLPLLWISLNISGFVIIFLYQMMHALPAIIFTKKDVIVYIGNYGDNSGYRFSKGRLTVYIKRKFSNLKGSGLCVYDTDVPFNQQLIILLTPPVITAMLFTLLVDNLVSARTYWIPEAIAAIFLISTFTNLLVNLIPRKIKVNNSDRVFYSDGYQVTLLLENKNNYERIVTAFKFYDENDFASALAYLKRTPDKFMDESIFNVMLDCYMHLKNYGLAKRFAKKHEKAGWTELLSATDYAHLGYADLQLRHHRQALTNLNKSITLDPNKFYSLYNRAFLYNILKKYNDAKNDLNKALFIEESSSYAYAQRAFTNLGLGRPGEALNDVENALSLDATNPYAYLTRGMYLLEKEKFTTALDNFMTAKKLDKSTLFIDEKINEAKAKMESDKAANV